jgi:asparagine synthase (glutamine-hydrolysing)
MCGISGILNLREAAPPDRGELERMIAALYHRGPDGARFYQDQTVGMAHARLSIIDLDGGWQPMHNERKTVWVVFNGEIFNYIELRATLEAQGHRFYTNSDTEAIVHLYEQYGLAFVDHLNGQFAIALWDIERKRLVLARDRTGIRPLFYTVARDRLIFASEVKALFFDASVPRRLDPVALAEVFTYWSALPPETVFEGISQLPPGHLMVAEAGKLSVRRYWDWDFPRGAAQSSKSADELAQEVRDLLIDSVRLQLRADVPVGAYLSGGLDSSVVVSLIRHYTRNPLRTFSISFEDAEFDESRYQQELVQHLGTDHTNFRCTRRDIAEAFPRTVWHAETPILRTAPTPLMLLAGHVREAGYRVVLTGEGADEVFAGYDIFKEAKVRRFWARAPQSRWRAGILGRLYPYLAHSPTSNPAYAQAFFGQGLEHRDRPYFSHVPRWSTTQRAWQFFGPAIRDRLNGFDPHQRVSMVLPKAISEWSPLARDQYLEAHTLLSGYLLSSQGDRMAMACSIEARFPFLDHRVIEHANALPARYKLMGLTEKYILKRAMAGLLPESIRTRSKQPYRAPDSQSFFVQGRPVEYVADLLSPASLREAGYFDPAVVERLVAKCRAGRAIGFADNMAFVGILSTMLVDRLLLRQPGATQFSGVPSVGAIPPEQRTAAS